MANTPVFSTTSLTRTAGSTRVLFSELASGDADLVQPGVQVQVTDGKLLLSAKVLRVDGHGADVLVDFKEAKNRYARSNRAYTPPASAWAGREGVEPAGALWVVKGPWKGLRKSPMATLLTLGLAVLVGASRTGSALLGVNTTVAQLVEALILVCVLAPVLVAVARAGRGGFHLTVRGAFRTGEERMLPMLGFTIISSLLIGAVLGAAIPMLAVMFQGVALLLLIFSLAAGLATAFAVSVAGAQVAAGIPISIKMLSWSQIASFLLSFLTWVLLPVVVAAILELGVLVSAPRSVDTGFGFPVALLLLALVEGLVAAASLIAVAGLSCALDGMPGVEPPERPVPLEPTGGRVAPQAAETIPVLSEILPDTSAEPVGPDSEPDTEVAAVEPEPAAVSNEHYTDEEQTVEEQTGEGETGDPDAVIQPASPETAQAVSQEPTPAAEPVVTSPDPEPALTQLTAAAKAAEPRVRSNLFRCPNCMRVVADSSCPVCGYTPDDAGKEDDGRTLPPPDPQTLIPTLYGQEDEDVLSVTAGREPAPQMRNYVRPAVSSSQPVMPPAGHRRLGLVVGVTSVVVIALLAGGVWMYQSRTSTTDTPTTAPTTAANRAYEMARQAAQELKDQSLVDGWPPVYLGMLAVDGTTRCEVSAAPGTETAVGQDFVITCYEIDPTTALPPSSRPVTPVAPVTSSVPVPSYTPDSVVSTDGPTGPPPGGVTTGWNPAGGTPPQTGTVKAAPFTDFPKEANAVEIYGSIWGTTPDQYQLKVTQSQGLRIDPLNAGRNDRGILDLQVQFPAQPGQNTENYFTISVTAPSGEELQAGKLYENATRAAFAGAGPGVDTDANGEGNNTLTGEFKLTTLKYNTDHTLRQAQGYLVLRGEGTGWPLWVQFSYTP